MIRIILGLVLLSSTLYISAQRLVTVNNVTAGNLKNTMSMEDEILGTDFVISGTLDARDFKTITDLWSLKTLDISNTNIVAYSGTEGPYEYITEYPANMLPHYGLSGCEGMTDIKLPLSITAIGDYAFYECKAMKEFTIPNYITSLGKNAFRWCSKLSAITFEQPSQITVLEDYVFTGCGSLKSIELPGTITGIKEGAFSTCDSLLSMNLPSSVKFIGKNGFASCFQMQEITIPSSVDSIGEYAFANCYELKEVVLPPSITSIGYAVFHTCYGMKSISIPATVTFIDNAFIFCGGLESIYCANPVPPAFPTSWSIFADVDKQKCTLYIPKGSEQLYRKAPYWKDLLKMQEQDFLSIGGNEMDEHGIAFYPNPVIDGIFIDNAEAYNSLHIIDMKGQVVFQQAINDNYINLSNLSSGIYLINIESVDGKQVKQKLIKK